MWDREALFEEVTRVRRDEGFGGSMVWYMGVVLLFGAAALWAIKAPWTVWAMVFGMGAVLTLLVSLSWGHAPRLLVVGERPDAPVVPLREALEGAGFELCTCTGPVALPCPVEMGKPCPLADRPVAAVIFRKAGDTGSLPPCGEAFLVPSIAVEEDSDRPTERAGRNARVGWKRGPAEVVHTLEDVLAA